MLVAQPCFISQVNVTAIDMNPERSTMRIAFKGEKHKREAINLAKAALYAAYEGTLYCALVEDKKEVFFTMVGGGSFRNELRWIARALRRLRTIIKRSGLHVTLAVLQINDNWEKQTKEWKKITDMAMELHGTIDTYPKPNPILPVAPAVAPENPPVAANPPVIDNPTAPGISTTPTPEIPPVIPMTTPAVPTKLTTPEKNESFFLSNRWIMALGLGGIVAAILAWKYFQPKSAVQE